MYVSLIDGRPFSEIYARQLISKISREELEDKYLRLQEDNQVRLIKLLFVFFLLKVFKNVLCGSFKIFLIIFEDNRGSVTIFKARTIKIARTLKLHNRKGSC